MSKTEIKLIRQLIDELKSQCNRHDNGHCATLTCLQRGGYQKGDIPHYEMSTCERHEQIKALETLMELAEPKVCRLYRDISIV